MKIRFDQPFKLVPLRDLEPGELFRDENNEGLFLKTKGGNVVVRPLDAVNAIGPGGEAYFTEDNNVVRIKQIIVFPEIV